MSMIVRIFGGILFHEPDSENLGWRLFHGHDSASIRSETLP